MAADDSITCLIQTSPIASHPSTAIFDQTFVSVRHHLPNARFIIMADGVRAEQEHYRDRYERYLWTLTERMKKGWVNVSMFQSYAHIHQVGCARAVLPLIETPLLMYLEHDTGLTPDRKIDWQGITDALLSGDVECIRFLNESRVAPHHLYLFEEQFEVCGVPLWKTRQWSQRPHVATVELYKRALAVFSAEANSMIEDRLMTFVEHSPWDNWKCAVYIPEDNYHRSLHLDGRGTDSKFEESMVF
jgi:hypothetical protein